MSAKWVKVYLIICAIYDGVIGLALSLFPIAVFRWFNEDIPHPGFVRFPGLLLLIFAAMFLRGAADPVGRRDIIVYGAALKIAFCSVVFWYNFRHNVPAMWVPLAYVDLVFLFLFILAWKVTGTRTQSAA